MSAEEVLDAWIDPCSSDTAAGILEALKDAGYAVVELPAPDAIASDQYHYWDDQDVLCHPGDGVGYYKTTELRVADMRQLGLALLAAADVAEADRA